MYPAPRRLQTCSGREVFAHGQNTETVTWFQVAMKRPVLKGAQRAALLRHCKRLFLAAGHDPKASGASVVAMVSVLAGHRISKDRAWKWLLARYDGPGMHGDLPSVRGRKRGLEPSTFYESREWRELRYKALALSDGRCELCGRSKQNGIVLHVDHIRPRSVAPELELCLENLQILCEDCNLGKSNKDSRDWRVRA